jgi:predicted ATPase
VAFLVGENGTGKSTLLEAIADLCGFPVSGGGKNESADCHGLGEESALARALRPSFRRRPLDGYFLRAELLADFASLLDARAADPDFRDNPYRRYGGRSLHTRSHGEAFLAVLENRTGAGLFLLDEPEAALSPQRQLALLLHMWRLAKSGAAQFIIATHSPVLLTFPEADLVSFDSSALPHITKEQTPHFQITRGILENPEMYWRRLLEEEER